MLTDSDAKADMIDLMLGLSHGKAGQLAEARQDFETLLSRSPGGRFKELTKEYLAEFELKDSFFTKAHI